MLGLTHKNKDMYYMLVVLVLSTALFAIMLNGMLEAKRALDGPGACLAKGFSQSMLIGNTTWCNTHVLDTDVMCKLEECGTPAEEFDRLYLDK